MYGSVFYFSVASSQEFKTTRNGCRMRSYMSDLYKITQKGFDKIGDISWCLCMLWHMDKVTPLTNMPM